MAEIDDKKVLKVLQESFRRHDIKLVQNDFWLVHENGVAVSGTAAVRRQSEESTTIQLDIDVSLPGGRLLTESFAGTGSSAREALNDSFHNFIANSFHVLATGFFGHPEEDHVAVETWAIDGTDWRAVIGNAGIRTSAGVTDVMPPADLMPRFETAIRASALHHDTHWFRVFFGQLNGEPAAEEWLQDSDDWPEGQRELSSLEWPKLDGYYSVRLFVLLRRENDLATALLDPQEQIAKGLDIVIDAWRDTPERPDAQVYQRLTNAGVSASVAERLLTFTPLGFSNIFLAGASLPDRYQIMGHDGTPEPEKPLAGEPTFLAARQLAEASSEDLVRTIASRCALVDAASQFADGIDNITPEKLKDALFAPPICVFPRFSPPTLAPSKPKKKWWKPW